MSTTSEKATVGTELQYFEHLGSGRFMIQRCSHCSQHNFPPREFCVHCGTDALQWVAPTGMGLIHSHTTVARKEEHGGNYNIVLVDLEEGPRVMSTVIGAEPGALHIGMKVQAKVEGAEDKARLVFAEVKA